MKVLHAKTAGFCFGVRRAVEMVTEQSRNGRQPVYTYGPIIHNEQVVRELEQKGVRVLHDLDQLKDMHSLTHVFMDYNLITDIDALADCYCLVQVNVFGNEIKDVKKLRDKDIIVNYDPTYGMKDKDK